MDAAPGAVQTGRRERMIEIKYTGMCEGCTCSDLELSDIRSNDGERMWFLHCNHKSACEAMKRKAKSKSKENSDA